MTRALLASVLALGSIAGAVSCGGTGSNNDQGTSFLALGYFGDETGGTGLSRVDALLAPDSATIVTAGGFQADGNQVDVFIGFQNRLSNQFIRLERVECSYAIPGASPLLAIPDDSYNTAAVISASPSSDDRDPDTGEAVPLPTDGGSRLFYGFTILSPDLISYINVNRNLLPELPFRMNVSCRGVAVAQSGDVLISNDVLFEVRFVDQAECCTGASGETIGDDGGFQSGTGSGGGIVFEDGTTSNGGGGAGAGATVEEGSGIEAGATE